MRTRFGYEVVMFEVRTFEQIVILDTQNLDHHSSEHIGVQIEPQGNSYPQTTPKLLFEVYSPQSSIPIKRLR
jgi:hypothetical protein